MIEIPELKELQFEEKYHTYKLNGFIIPSVSTLMKPLSSAHYKDVDEEMLHKASVRGKTVHEAVENYLLYGVEDIKPELRGYFEGFKAWIDKNKPQTIKTECRIYHKTMLYAGTADLPCYVGGKATLVDWKTTATISKMLTRVQLEAYKQAFESHGIKFEQKLIIQARNDGTYSEMIHPIVDVESWKVFSELLDIHRFIKKYQ